MKYKSLSVLIVFSFVNGVVFASSTDPCDCNYKYALEVAAAAPDYTTYYNNCMGGESASDNPTLAAVCASGAALSNLERGIDLGTAWSNRSECVANCTEE